MNAKVFGNVKRSCNNFYDMIKYSVFLKYANSA